MSGEGEEEKCWQREVADEGRRRQHAKEIVVAGRRSEADMA